jgi:hypothetical protein
LALGVEISGGDGPTVGFGFGGVRQVFGVVLDTFDLDL